MLKKVIDILKVWWENRNNVIKAWLFPQMDKNLVPYLAGIIAKEKQNIIKSLDSLSPEDCAENIVGVLKSWVEKQLK